MLEYENRTQGDLELEKCQKVLFQWLQPQLWKNYILWDFNNIGSIFL